MLDDIALPRGAYIRCSARKKLLYERSSDFSAIPSSSYQQHNRNRLLHPANRPSQQNKQPLLATPNRSTDRPSVIVQRRQTGQSVTTYRALFHAELYSKRELTHCSHVTFSSVNLTFCSVQTIVTIVQFVPCTKLKSLNKILTMQKKCQTVRGAFHFGGT